MSKSVGVLLLFALAAAGCGDDSTGPSEANLAGAWTLSATNVSGQGVSCNLSPTPVTISQSGTTFTGTYGPGTVTCVSGTESVSFSVQGSVVNGSVSGNAVQFDLDTQDVHHTGSLSGNSMSGTVRWTIDFGGDIGIVTLNGNWAAARQ
ncbi:MAG: hypothetical protein ACREMZ_12400 [Gemmatimonadales bacterium]